MRRVFALALASLAVPSAAHAAGPAFERLDGDLRTRIVLTPDGARVADYRFDWRVPCSDGKPLVTGMVRASERPQVVGGAFGFDSGTERTTLDGRRATYRAVFSAQVAADGQTVTGTARVTIRSDQRTCEQEGIPILAYLHGRPEAPDRTALVATGTYRMTGSSISRKRRMRVNAALSEIERVDFRWTIPCGNGRTIWGDQRVLQVPIDPETGSFSIAFPQTGSFKDGRRSRDRFRFEGTFRRAGDGFVVDGTYSVRSVVTRKGKRLYTCRTEGSPFSAVLG